MRRASLFGILLSSFLLSLCARPPLWAGTPSQTDLRRDFSHYVRVSQKNNYGPNDRLYILYRLREKYAESGLDLSDLEGEILSWEKARQPSEAAPPAPADPPAETAGPGAAPRLVHVGTRQEAGRLKLVLELTDPVLPQALRVDDPKRPGQPLLLIDLPGAQNALSNVARELRWNSGPLESVATEEKADGALRVRIQLREDRPYRIVRAGREVSVEIKTEEAGPALSQAPPAAGEEDADKSYVIQSGDLLNVQVAPAKELSRETVVQPDGTLVFPLLGTLPVKGMSVGQLETHLTQQLRPYVAKPRVTVSIKQFSNRNVFLMGKVSRPGPVPYKSGLRLLNAVSEAGGFSEDADRTAIKVYRGREGERKTFSVNAQEILSQGDLSRDFSLEPGDIVEVPRGGNTVFIIGQVNRPGNYGFREGYTLLELVSEAGGVTVGSRAKKVKIFREASPRREAIHVNLARIMRGHPEEDVSLKPGDIVLIPQNTFYSGTAVATNLLQPWLYLTTLIITVILLT